MDPVTISFAIAGAAVAAGAAKQRNDAIQRSMQSANEAAATQAKQLAEQTALERQKRTIQSEQVEGRLRVAATEAGAGFDGSFAALSFQNAADAQVDDLILQRNYSNNIARVMSGLAATQAELESKGSSLALAAIGGGLQGAQVGQSVNGMLKAPGGGIEGVSLTDTGMNNIGDGFTGSYMDMNTGIALT